jgi:thiol-disulfide isomerase/thioredoxin
MEWLLLIALAQGPRTVFLSLDQAQAVDAPVLRRLLGAIDGVTGVGIDAEKHEVSVRLDRPLPDRALIKALDKKGVSASTLPGREIVGGPDRLILSPDGSAVGPLEPLRVRNKYTVFDVFADWCAPCKIVDTRLQNMLAERSDVAVRGLNLVSFETPLAQELAIDALPHMIVFSPSGVRTDIDGADLVELEKAVKHP